ncbi:threonylcarbamoyladenosine tRNA methylthiotransferase MtaB [Methylobacterium brachiatum]|uniref:Threonylcarbamoyladenosine tRNA methylthiotransferase MtaB n=1 Tax=Methylobacterium brachiatum TaxID=269660 RepID=A0AAJ1WVH0_9HYPH|nr:tRNA (N(6)-L-threonylcarbamoyladenosine(37)-C(2))-methylthiotransferase MtaB [Methylobacterium brachiatum]MCB4801869.1 tRNA (N(6)-L-threonylcarbamoyladenosine(37)-C(2))-methylthiotransferase MtaB [Methylobacterium brachiatum]MDQ0542205.1 threonylcarbamoyladenosine tRNA methylthiotransferase MtaB [Methylobacterium brachiatum]
MGVETLTFGCRLNTVESEALRVHAAADGRDRVVVNTCAVTQEAGRQARKAIRRIARVRPGTEIVVTGCGAEVETEAYAAMPEVARLVGNAEKLSPAGWSPAATGPGAVMAARTVAPTRIDAIAGHTRAFVPVQNGCDHRCTFCVIPFGRGTSRSVPVAEVVAQVETIVAHGGREVVLTGVDLTAYGRDLPEPSLSLGGLVRAILRAVPELARLRISSIDSVEVDDALLAALVEEERLMPHLHLSLQAGDDLILKRMKRRHSRADAIRFCATVRALRPDVVFGADLIAGFPTETEDQFARSLDLVAECGLTHLHVFPYSPRPGTPAARMPPVAPDAIRDRAARLRAAGAAALRRHLNGQVGRTLTVLAERGGTGRSADFTPVRLAGEAEAGTFHAVTIAGHDGARLIAA